MKPAGSDARGRLFCPIWSRHSPRWVQIALKPAAESSGMHRIFVHGLGCKCVIADSAFKRMQVDPRARWLDADEHHLGLAPGTGRALKWSWWNGGRRSSRLVHGASFADRREHNTLCHRQYLGVDGDNGSMRRTELKRESIRLRRASEGGCGSRIKGLGLSFQEVVHSALTGDAEVAEASDSKRCHLR